MARIAVPGEISFLLEERKRLQYGLRIADDQRQHHVAVGLDFELKCGSELLLGPFLSQELRTQNDNHVACARQPFLDLCNDALAPCDFRLIDPAANAATAQ